MHRRTTFIAIAIAVVATAILSSALHIRASFSEKGQTATPLPVMATRYIQQAAQGNLLAIRTVVMDSSRHIVSTTLTTFGGFLPLILEGSQFWPPFAMAIAGGVLLSTIVSFFLVPPMFVLAAQWQAGEKQSRQLLADQV